MELDDNKRLDLDEYRRIIYKDIERRYPSFNKITPMPRLYRTHHSCNIKDELNHSFSSKKTSKSIFKVNHSVHNSASSIMKTYMTTTFTETPSPTNNKKEPKILVSIHKPNKENTDILLKENSIEEEKEHIGTKIFKRKVKRNLWKKQ